VASIGRAASLVFVALLILTVGGCTSDNAQALFDTAQLEERQNNPKHAKELYQEIITKYPKSEHARKAEERLRELEKAR
jgi:outer membrane protein assembly factor BamD (BamD/ComL family)